MVNFSAETEANLRLYVPGFENLKEDARRAIEEFSLLWQVFEGRRADTNFGTNKALEMKWCIGNQALLIEVTADSYEYFQFRYALAVDHQDRLGALIGKQGNQKVRTEIASGLLATACDRQKLIALILICYRLRNNSFHGVKVIDNYEGQLNNFTNAIKFLNAVLSQQS